MSMVEIPGYHKVEKFYVSAFEATVHRPTNKLSSVINLSPDYRGGNNNAAWDGAASNARTYTPDDVRELLAGHDTPGYRFEIGSHRVGHLPGKCSYVLGFPVGS